MKYPKMTTEEMLRRLTRSANEIVRVRANHLLSHPKEIDKEKDHGGSFMSAVLNGDSDLAILCADEYNRFALTRQEN